MSIERRIQRAVTEIGVKFRPVEVWINANGIWVDPVKAIAWGEMVGVYDARQRTFDPAIFAQDVYATLGGA